MDALDIKQELKWLDVLNELKLILEEAAPKGNVVVQTRSMNTKYLLKKILIIFLKIKM